MQISADPRNHNIAPTFEASGARIRASTLNVKTESVRTVAKPHMLTGHTPQNVVNRQAAKQHDGAT